MAHMKLEYKSAALTRGVSLEIFLPTDGWGAEVPFPYRKRRRLGNSRKSSKIKDLRCC